MPTPKLDSKKWLWLTLLLTTIIILIVEIPLLTDPQYVDEDLRFFYWLHRFTNPSLFEVDPLLGYQFAEVNLGFVNLLFNKVSLLYGILYAILSPLLSPFLFSKLLIFPLGLISSFYLFQIGEHITNSFTAFLLSTIFIFIVAVPYSQMSLSSGLPRAFTLPLLLAMLYYMIIDNYWGMAVVLVMGLFYPPVFLTVLLTYGVKYAFESFHRRRLALTRNQIVVYFAALFVSILLLLPAVSTGLNTVPTDSETLQETTVFASPLFGDEGRYPLQKPPLTGNGGIIDNGLIGFYSLLFVPVLIPIALILRRQFNFLPLPFWYLAIASLIGFGISWLAILFTPSASFHMPSRYMRGTIFIMWLVMFIINGPLAVQKASKYLTNNRGNLDLLLFLTSVVGLVFVYFSGGSTGLTAIMGLLVIVIGVLVVIIRKRPRTTGWRNQVSATQEAETLNVRSEETYLRVQSILVILILLLTSLFYTQGQNNYYRLQPDSVELVNFVKTLPMNTLISGYPCFLDDIPLYSKRAILFSCETESRDMELMTATLKAYFAESEEDVLAFCQRYNVDYMVAGRETFTETFRSQEHIIFEPLNSFLKQQLEGRFSFAVEQIPDERKIFQNNSYFVFPCNGDNLVSTQ